MELLEKILERGNLNEAYKRVYANKGASGVDGVTVEELLSYLKDHKAELLESIRTRKYKPQPVKRVEIPKESGGKRPLGIPTVVDRVIQQATVQVLSPIYEEQFSNSSYGFRVGRSCEQAVIRSLELINDGWDWIVDIDLERFFDTVHHDRLMNIISHKKLSLKLNSKAKYLGYGSNTSIKYSKSPTSGTSLLSQRFN